MCIDPGGGPMEDKKEELPGKIKLIGSLTCVNSGLIIILSLWCLIIFLIYALIYGTVLAFVTYGLGALLYCCPLIYFPTLIWGIFELVMGIRLLMGKRIKRAPIYMGIIDIIIGAYLTFSLLFFGIYFTPLGLAIVIIGILNIVFLMNPEAKEYFGKEDIEDEYAEYLKDD